MTANDISFSNGLSSFLQAQGISLCFTSYQAGGLYFIGHEANGNLSLHQSGYSQAMGVVGDSNRIFLGTHTEIVRLENVLQPDQLANNQYDRLYVPRNIQITGSVDIHEVGVRSDGQLLFINTRYSCLCVPSPTHSFKPVWKPAFISKLAPEDRCHLNGLAMRNGEPAFVSAVCQSDVVDGWRDRRHDGGVVIDVQSNSVVAEGLSMPHSPRWHDGRLWVLNSGSGELGWIDEKKKTFNAIAFFPGFLRGLAFHNGHAIVTLSKPRYERFDGLELAARLEEKDADPWCGVQIISLTSGDVVQWIRFDGAITELFDVCVLRNVKNPLTIGLNTAELKSFITLDPAGDSAGGPAGF